MTLPDADMYYDTAGDHGTPIMLVMGLGMPGRAWKNQVGALSEHHRIVWFDHRGSGQTKAQPGFWSMGTLVSDSIALMDHLEWSDAHIVGVSMGGMVAQHLALTYRSRVRSLTLIATHAGGFRSRLPTPSGLWRFISANGASPDQRMDHLMSLLFPPDAFESAERTTVREALMEDLADRQPARYRLSQLAAIMGHNTHSRLHELQGIPTLVAKPGKDILVRPKESDRLAKQIPNAVLCEFPNAGHGIIRQEAPALNRELLRHFASVDAQGR